MKSDAKKPKILLTGGHLSPMLAVLAELKPQADVVVIGRKYTFEEDKTESLEYAVLHDLGVHFYNLKAGRLQRKLSKHTVPSLIRSPKSLLAARNILKKEKPDVVLTFGGYIGVPVAYAAWTLGIPVVLHEQTQQAGLTNRAIGKIATKILISYPSSFSYFNSDKTIHTGNPIRPEVFEVKKSLKIPEKAPVLYVTGGSTGAHFINVTVEYLLSELTQEFVIIHQTGDSQTYKDFERLEKLRAKLPEEKQRRYILQKFILPEHIGWVYKTADVVLSRSGANTVAELLALQKKALLIPLPYGQKEEQKLNAKSYEESGLGTFIEQKNATLSHVAKELMRLKNAKLPKATSTQKTNAAKDIAQIVLEVAQNNF